MFRFQNFQKKLKFSKIFKIFKKFQNFQKKLKWDFQTEPSAAGARRVVRNVWVPSPTIPKPSAGARRFPNRAERRRREASRHKCPRPDDPPRPCRPKAGQGLVMMMMMMMMMLMMMMTMMMMMAMMPMMMIVIGMV